MTKPAEKLSPELEVIAAAAEQQTTLANLLELCAHDFSEFHPLEIGVSGRFGYPSLPLYWSEPGRYPNVVCFHSLNACKPLRRVRRLRGRPLAPRVKCELPSASNTDERRLDPIRRSPARRE